MNKRVAILTQPLGHNYGGLMQAWALQQVITHLGYNVITIDRQPTPPSLLYFSARIVYRVIQKILGKRKIPILIESQKRNAYRNTNDFIDQKICMSVPIYSTNQLTRHFNKIGYEAVIVGSDQTWRPKYSPCIENYYLDFLEKNNIKKIAYASSFGVGEWEYDKSLTKKCSRLIKLFDWVSVREDSGVELCKHYLNIEVDQVFDPTLLLNKKEYKELIGEDRLLSENKGIYTYILDPNTEKCELIEVIAEKLNETIFNCQAKYSLENAMDINDATMPDPKDWLAGFANAEYVITDSFHGMVFSIIFNKKFLVIPNKDRGLDRFYSLLKILNLQDRIQTGWKDQHEVLSKDIDYFEINELIFSRSREIKSRLSNELE